MDNWKEAFLFLLIDRYVTRFKINGLKEPEKVKEFTNEYQRQSDIYYEYISEQLQLTGNSKDRINLTTMYNDFKMWYKEAHTERKIPARAEFKENVEEKIGKMKSNGWRGIRFGLEKNVNESDSDSDCESEKNLFAK